MLGKKILAGIFAVMILLKIMVLVINPNLWMGAVAELLKQPTTVMIIYLGLLVVTGFYIFSQLNLLDIALVMFFTSMLLALSILPYAGVLLKMREEIISIGLGKARLALLLWGALAVAVLYKVFSPTRRQWR
jgi:4-amino-4-deoxy-L-arabinose transferase-like glycosyltransferase